MAVIKGEIDDYETGDTFAKRAQGTSIFLLAYVLSLVALASTTEPAYEVRRLDATQHCPTTCGAYANRTKMRDEITSSHDANEDHAAWWTHPNGHEYHDFELTCETVVTFPGDVLFQSGVPHTRGPVTGSPPVTSTAPAALRCATQAARAPR